MGNVVKAKELCSCGAVAQWVYMPGYSGGGNPYRCDDCVGRGCSCNTHSTKETYRDLPDDDEVEGKDWEWIDVDDKYVDFKVTKPKTYWRRIDEKGRPYPCCEYSYEENGFYTQEYETHLEEECKRIGYDILSDPDEARWFEQYGHIVWTDDLIEKIEKIIEEYGRSR